MFKRNEATTRDNGRPSRKRAAQPRLEGLEDRMLLFATSGDLWSQTARVTFSFMPDGTSIGGTPSNLFQTMNQVAPQSAWQGQFTLAAAEWQDVAKINLVGVGDDGSPVGSGSYQQGAPNFGDIRVGAMPLPEGELASTFLPPPNNGGSDAGDIIFNSNVNWGSGGFDFMTVALHELGHALGMDHSSLTSAAMYTHYTGIKEDLNSDDVSGIQSIYGARYQSDLNTSALTAAPIVLDGNAQATLNPRVIQLPTCANWFSVVAPLNTSGTLSVTMQATNLSLLEPRLTIYNGNVQGLADASTTTLGGTVTATITGVMPGQIYYIRAAANTSGEGSAGRYALLVNLGTGTMAPAQPPNTQVASQWSQGSTTESLSAGRNHTIPNKDGIVTIGDMQGQGDALMANVRTLRHGRHRH